MKKFYHFTLPSFIFLLLLIARARQTQAQTTYCNPLNIDYGHTPIPGAAAWGAHRATADPVIVRYKGDYYLFSTNQRGYWWSANLSDWHFVSRSFLRPDHDTYDDLCAPAVGIIGDTMLVFGSTYTRDFPIWMSTEPKKADSWTEAVHKFDIGGWDPAFFTDTDGRLYLYNGSSNRYPIYGVELDRRSLQPLGARKELYTLEPERYGWQRFGEHLDNTFLDPFIEGAWMTKYGNRYYLQYGAPGTEFSGYADGVLVGPGPLGPFTPQSDPFSYKPGGFIRGAGHGSTFQDTWGNYWHTSTLAISVKNNFERRIGLWPAGFDADSVMYCNTAFGDYPHYLPNGPADHLQSRFTGWMLLNYQKPVQASSALPGHPANHAVDENVKTWWAAASNRPGEWFQSDLGDTCTVYAIQVNHADQGVDFMGKSVGVYYRYKLWHSLDGKKWRLLSDRSQPGADAPHDYLELPQPLRTRYIRIEFSGQRTGAFALSGLRVFGRGDGPPPPAVREFIVLRTEKDPRSAWLKWRPVDEAWAYNIYFGTSPDKLYNCIMVHDANEYWFKGMDARKTYYFSIEALNENGVSLRSGVVEKAP